MPIKPFLLAICLTVLTLLAAMSVLIIATIVLTSCSAPAKATAGHTAAQGANALSAHAVTESDGTERAVVFNSPAPSAWYRGSKTEQTFDVTGMPTSVYTEQKVDTNLMALLINLAGAGVALILTLVCNKPLWGITAVLLSVWVGSQLGHDNFSTTTIALVAVSIVALRLLFGYLKYHKTA